MITIEYKENSFVVEEMTVKQQEQLKSEQPELFAMFRDKFPKTKATKVADPVQNEDEITTEVNPK